MKIAILETNMMRETKSDTVRIIFNAGDCPVVYGDGNCDTGQHVIVEGEKSDLLTWFSKHRYVWVGSSNLMMQEFTAAKVNAEGTALEGYDFSDREAIEETNAYVRWCDEQSRAFVEARLLVLAQDDKRRSLAQEIAQTLRVRGYWVPDDIMSSDLISAVGQAVSMLKALGEKIADNELPSDTKPKDIVDGILHILDLMASDSREINRRNEVVWTEGMLEFIRRALNCTSHIIEGYEGNPDVQALVQLGVFEVIGNDMYHLRNAGYGT